MKGKVKAKNNQIHSFSLCLISFLYNQSMDGYTAKFLRLDWLLSSCSLCFFFNYLADWKFCLIVISWDLMICFSKLGSCEEARKASPDHIPLHTVSSHYLHPEAVLGIPRRAIAASFLRGIIRAGTNLFTKLCVNKTKLSLQLLNCLINFSHC